MKRFLSELALLTVLLIPFAVSADTTFTCPECFPAVADTWPHTGKYGAGTRHYFMHNYWHKDLTVHVNGNGGAGWTNLTFTLKIGHDTIIEIPNGWASARIWGLWDPKYANGPFTLAEITSHAGWGCDWYDVSLVDGYNLPMLYYPLPGTFPPDNPKLDSTYGRQGWTCGGEDDCTKDLYLTAPASMLNLDTINGVLDTNGFYCSGDVGSPCAALKKAACPTSYSYPYDDPHSLFTCPSPTVNAAGTAVGPDYILDFGLPPTSLVDNNKKLAINRTILGNASITITRNKELKYLYGGQGPAWLEIYSCSGKLMLRTAVNDYGTIAVPQLNRGVYIVSLKSDRVLATKQMLVSR
ncbi:MAG TPA: thaumatin family protein [Chitinivibrionales bacterium]|nr:thaumatin family protein [Chitinivibrionales bacterium]